MDYIRSANHCIWLVVGNWLCMFVPPKNGIMISANTGSHWSKIVLTNHKRFAGHCHRSGTAPRNPEPMVNTLWVPDFGWIQVSLSKQNVLPGFRSHISRAFPPETRHWYSNVGGSIVKMGDSDIHMPLKTSDKKHKASEKLGDVAIWYIYIHIHGNIFIKVYIYGNWEIWLVDDYYYFHLFSGNMMIWWGYNRTH